LSTAENLKASSFGEFQAKAITETVREAQQQNLDVLATKGDLENGLENLEFRLSGKITLLQWMLAIVIAAEVLLFFSIKPYNFIFSFRQGIFERSL
jgi:hypothetical protein